MKKPNYDLRTPVTQLPEEVAQKLKKAITFEGSKPIAPLDSWRKSQEYARRWLFELSSTLGYLEVFDDDTELKECMDNLFAIQRGKGAVWSFTAISLIAQTTESFEVLFLYLAQGTHFRRTRNGRTSTVYNLWRVEELDLQKLFYKKHTEIANIQHVDPRDPGLTLLLQGIISEVFKDAGISMSAEEIAAIVAKDTSEGYPFTLENYRLFARARVNGMPEAIVAFVRKMIAYLNKVK